MAAHDAVESMPIFRGIRIQRTYNEGWLIERHGHRPPAAIREEQTVINREAA